ncbi:hypothetical protein EV421DRAFT_927771 [Armillaria borealis]|uniref:DUF6534 domain-containing protein n=1 Tax=Armillaria borealis TaxID=47425 RepID=A0AA39JE44_9AGAR|nr:hypothetical protein EV421DRAFT_927771 [Armillaria borealis]
MASAPSSQTIRIQYIGPVFFGCLLNWCLLGALTVQLYSFHVCFPKERTPIKGFVYILYILDLAQTVGSTHYSYHVLVYGWGDLFALMTVTWSIAIVPILTGVISLAVQLFFAWRIWTLKRGNRLFQVSVVTLISAIGLMQCVAAFVGGIKYALAGDTAALASMSNLVKVWLIGSFVCDIVIALAMLFILGSMRHKSHWQRTNGRIRKLMYHTVESGAITAVAAGVDLSLFLAAPNANYHLVLSFTLGKLYTNIVLATLNNRSSRTGAAEGSVSEVNILSENFPLSVRRSQGDTGGKSAMIHVSRDVQSDAALSSNDLKAT